MKMLVPACRSSSSSPMATSSAGATDKPRIEATRYDQTVSGIRQSDIPGALMLNTVATMSKAVRTNEAVKNAMPISQMVCPVRDPGTADATALSGGYAVQ